MQITGITAFVTGAASGLGAATAALLAAKGAQVWWDITTPGQFQMHLDKYENFGLGIGLFTK